MTTTTQHPWVLVLGAVLCGATVAACVVACSSNSNSTKKKKRRTSLATALQANRVNLEKNMGMKQNMVNAILCFADGDAPTRDEMVGLMTKLARKFERIRCRPVCPDPKATTCNWEPVEDLEAAIDRCVTQETISPNNERAMLQRVEEHKAKIVLGHDETTGASMPLWRIIILNPSTVLVRMDHSIGDGLSLVTLLREIATRSPEDRDKKASSSSSEIRLGDLSPLLRYFESFSDRAVQLRPLALLWPPNLWRAISFMSGTISAEKEMDNPLRPKPEHFYKVIPPECSGTVYFPTLSVSLFKKLAKGVGDGTTVNDVLLFCLSDTFRRYFSQVGVPSDFNNRVRLLLPIGNPRPPSSYGDEFEGLCNNMTPVPVPLDVSNKIETNPTEVLNAIKAYMEKVRRSHVTLLLSVLNQIFAPLLTLDQVSAASRDVFERQSCVYSNVPGPTIPIWIAGHRLLKLQTILPHPVSIFQALSYNGSIYFNITLDVRAAARPWLLRDAFVESIQYFSKTWNVQDPEIDACATSTEWGGQGVVFTSNGL